MSQPRAESPSRAPGRPMPSTRPRLAAAAAGAAAAVLGVGVAELIAGIAMPAASPIAAIAGALIDGAPPWGKDLAIALFGTGDKVALVVAVVIVVVAVAALAGVLQAARRPFGVVLAALAGVGGAVVAVSRPEATAAWALPSLIGAFVAMIALWLLARRLPAMSGAPDPQGALSRRGFVGWTAGVAVVGVLAVVGGRIAEAGARVVTVARDALRLPAAAVPAPPLPAGADFGITGLAPILTPNPDFYLIDIAIVPPVIDPASWSLRIHGLVEREVVIGWEELLTLPLEERDVTLMCVSNPVGGPLVGTARWLGYPVRELLARAGVRSNADMVLSRSPDGFTASTPIEALTDPDLPALLAIGMNGEPLPVQHGFPARLVVPGLYGYVSATKWVTELELTRFDAVTAYWTDRGWAPRGPVKLQSRIDIPRYGAQLPAGPVVVAGVAWQPHVGIDAVQLQIDDGAWLPAELSAPIGIDSWRQWRVVWDAEPGQHRLRVRATSAAGELQTEKQQTTVPDGATGLHTVTLSVA